MGINRETSIINKESEFSNFRESMVEHRFIAELMEYCWQRDFFDIQVLHSEIDDSGYDLVVSIKNNTSFLQLKVTSEESRVCEFPIHQNLVSKPNAFILLIEYEKSNISIHKRHLKPITSIEWDDCSPATNSHNRAKERNNVRMIKRKSIKNSKDELSIEGVFNILSGNI